MADEDARYRAMLDAVPDAVVAIDTDGRILFVNAETEALFGYARTELVGGSVEVLVPDSVEAIRTESQSYLGQTVNRAVSGGAGLEMGGRRKDGSRFPAEISLSAIETVDGLLISVAIRDGSERRLLALVASSLNAVVSMDIDGTVLTWNPAAERMFGPSATDAIGRNIAAVVGDDALCGVDDHLEQVRRGAYLPEYEVAHGRDGATVDVAASWFPIVDGDGNVKGVSLLCRDITEHKQAEEQRKVLESHLNQSQRLESLGQLAGGIAHDFNNLLAVILSYAMLVGEAVEDNPEAKSDVEQIRSAAERAAALTQQLLIFGRQETIQMVVIDVNEVVISVRDMLSRTLGEHIELALRLDPGVLAILADRGRVEQVLVNLAVNARDAMPDGGVLTIATGAVDLDEAYAEFHPGAAPGSYVQVSVSDTGFGMSADVMAHALEPFYTTKPTGSGTGLGLATVYGIVTDAGGSLNLYSEEGLGTVVSAYLPSTTDRVADSPTNGKRVDPTGDGEIILLVEDEEAMRRVTARVLRRNGYVVLEAATAEVALAFADQNRVQLLVTDVVMPHVSGRDLADRIQAEHCDIPVLFMSGYSRGVLGPRLAEGVRLIQKPFNQADLLTGIRAALTNV